MIMSLSVKLFETLPDNFHGVFGFWVAVNGNVDSGCLIAEAEQMLLDGKCPRKLSRVLSLFFEGILQVSRREWFFLNLECPRA